MRLSGKTINTHQIPPITVTISIDGGPVAETAFKILLVTAYIGPAVTEVIVGGRAGPAEGSGVVGYVCGREISG